MTLRTLPIHQLDLEALGIALPMSADHPNRQPFEGVLTRVNEPSTRPPAGAQGHRVLIPAAVAEKALPTLIGMAVDVHIERDRTTGRRFRDHDAQHKIGIISEAWLDGNDLRVRGFLYAKDFADVIEALREQHARLGMSYEITSVQVEDESAPIWTLADLVFTGAAILEKSAAAYERTSMLARRERRSRMKQKALQDLEHVRDRLSGTLAAMRAGADEDEDEEHDEKAAEETAATEAKRKADEDAARVAAARRKADDEAAARRQAEEEQEAEHDDEEEDMTLLKRLVKKYESKKKHEAEADTTVLAASIDRRLALIERRLTQMEAAQELHTDTAATMTELITDMVQNHKTLATDRPRTTPQGGKELAGGEKNGHGERPARKTFAASDSHQFLTKYGLEADKPYTTGQIDEALRTAGVTDPTQRVAVKHYLESTGQLS